MAVRRIDNNGAYYNLDSLLAKPVCLGGEAELKSFLRAKLTDDKTQMLLVVRPDVAQNGKWEDCSDVTQSESVVRDGNLEVHLTGGAN